MPRHGARDDAVGDAHVERPYIKDENRLALVDEPAKLLDPDAAHAQAPDKQLPL
jgi:hypothetical protein